MISSILVLFTIISIISVTPAAFADHHEVSIVTGSVPLSAPGCEETNECYTPGDVTVDVGGVVTMTNTDATGIHTYTSGTVDGFAASPDGTFDSGILNADQSFEWTSDTEGEYPYYCMLHVWMQGTITVQAAAEEMMEETMEEEAMMEDKEGMMEETMMEKTMEEEMMEMETMMVGDVDVTMSPPILGSDDATVTIIEFGDYQCPKCDQWFQNEKPTITADYIDTDKAKLYFVDFPFLGQDSDNAANASHCANDQGQFWEYHGTLYNNQGGINEGWANVDTLKQFGADLGLDMAEFNSCVDSNKHADRVSYNKQVGTDHGVEGTPVFIIISSDGTTERIDGPQSSDIFADVINSMLGEAMAQEMEDNTMDEAMMEDKEEMMEDTMMEDKEEMMEDTMMEDKEEMMEDTMMEDKEEMMEDTMMEDKEEMMEDTMMEDKEEMMEDTMMEDKEEMMEDTMMEDKEGGGCLIATAAYGTELAPQVQFLREIRDNTVMSTSSGAAFMTGFNQLYYSFSPSIADLERENPMFQEAVRAFITPMISTLSIMTLAEDGSEVEVLGLGASVIALNLGMYIAAPALVGFAVSKRLRK